MEKKTTNFTANSYTWRSHWISTLESSWSVLEKFKFMNCISNKELLKVFGNSHVRKLKQVGTIHKDLYRLDGFGEDTLNDAIQQDYINNNFKQIRFVSKSNYNCLRYFRKYLWYCPICISVGYHSLLHQYMFIHKCPFHLVPLKNQCPKCNKIQKFLIDDINRLPFKCQCGFDYLKENRNPLDWKKYEGNQIKDKNVLTWLNHKEINFRDYYFSNSGEEFEEIHHINEEFIFDHELDDLLQVLNYKEKNKVCVIKGHKNLGKIRSYEQFREEMTNQKVFSDYDYNYSITEIENIDEELFRLSDNIFSSIARHLRKTYLRKHLPCLKQLTRNYGNLKRKEICPYAFAYAIWRARSQHFTSIENVDNFGYTPIYRSPRREYSFPIINQYPFLFDIITDWRRKYSRNSLNRYTEKRAGIKWIVGKCLEKTIISDFHECLKIIKDHLNEVPYNRKNYFSPKVLPRLIISNKNFEIYMKETSTSNSAISSYDEISKHFTCPNNSVKKRRGPKTSYIKPNPLDFMNR